ncbi:MAG: polysaccharide biosynthesis/export family protein [Pseudomonadota bacterium]
MTEVRLGLFGKVRVRGVVVYRRKFVEKCWLAILVLITSVTCASVNVQVNAEELGGSSSSALPLSDPCANTPEAIGCNKAAIVLANQKAQTQSKNVNDGQRDNPLAKNVFPPEPPTEFEKFVAETVATPLKIFGQNLFTDVPNTFSPVDNIPVTSDYIIGPGDELVIKGWGQVDIDLSVVVDRNGTIALPRVGTINVSGVRYRDLQGYLKQSIGRVFRNFELDVSLGKLRSIQVFVVGRAKRPGAYTVSSLSTLVNTLFVSGGPSSTGSFRSIQVKRNGSVVTEFDMYDFLLKGDKSHDIALQPGDVIFIPPVGALAAVAGSVNAPAIFELRKESGTLAELVEMAGGLSTVAKGEKVRVERIDDRRVRKVDEFLLDQAGLAKKLKDGDVVQVGSISGQFDNAVTLRGNVANPGRYPWREGMRVSDLIPSMDALIAPEYWTEQNKLAKGNKVSKDSLQAQFKNKQNEINWDYALVERLDKVQMTNVLLPFNLGKAVGNKDRENDLVLQAGDVVTIFSQSDMQVPVAKRSVYVRLEGEFNHAGLYRALPGETLRQLVVRVGGLTSQAYLLGSELTRESVREIQQKRLDEMLDRMEFDLHRKGADASTSGLSKEDADAAKSRVDQQRQLIGRMRQVKAGGRVVLDLPMRGATVNDLPDIELEDGDRFYVPMVSSTVNVMGMVYNQNAFIYKAGQKVNDYLAKSGGPTRDGDEDDIYLVGVDGRVLSMRNSGSIFGGGLGGYDVMPGATIVVPERLEKYNLTRSVKDWVQIFYQFALGVAGLKTLGVIR